MSNRKKLTKRIRWNFRHRNQQSFLRATPYPPIIKEERISACVRCGKYPALVNTDGGVCVVASKPCRERVK